MESERVCEAVFLGGKEWWHLYTPGNLTTLLFKDNDDYRFVMNMIARCLSEFPALSAVAFEVMSNHIHMVLNGDRDLIKRFFEVFRRRLHRYLSAKGRSLSRLFQMSLKPINNLKALRNTIVYVNRNGYVVNPGYTPFSYPWGTGRFYFNVFPITERLSDLPDKAIRRMFRGRNPHLPDDTGVIDGHIVPTAYCDIGLGMSLFRNAHQYFFMVSKNVEAYEELASELDDGEFLTDTELFSHLCKIVDNGYGGSSMKDLSPAQKRDLARMLRHDFRSSNGQIRRMLGLTQNEVDSMFPLTASGENEGLTTLRNGSR